MKIKILEIAILLSFFLSCAGPFMINKTEWTVPEVKEWYSENLNNEVPAWDGILYQGTDKQFHYFVTRVLDEWVFIKILKNKLNIEDVRDYSNTSTSALGYYFVDPIDNFKKTSEYHTINANGN